MSKHTPGEWDIIQRESGYRMITAEGPRGRLELALVYSEAEYGTLPAEANARLIAAAPDLLEALKYVEGADEITDTDWKRIRAAIAKAEGQES